MHIKGIVFTVISAILFGCSPTIVQQAYHYGATAETVTFFRNFFAIPIVFVIMFFKKISFQTTKKQLFSIFLIALFGLATATLTLVSSYPYIGTSMATTLHFLYPVFVALICFVFFKEKISKGKLFALILASIGICFFFEKSDGNTNVNLGIFLSVLSGLAYAFYMVGLDKFHLRTLNPMTLTLYLSIFAACSVFLCGIFRKNISFALPIEAYFYMLCNSIFISFFAVALLQVGVRYLSATIAAMFSLFEPVTSNIIGIFFMGEEMTIKKMIGSIIILSAVCIIVFLEKPTTTSKNISTNPIAEDSHSI